MLTERDFQVLLAVARYYVLNRPQIQHLCFATDQTGRVTRRRLQALVSQGLLNRHRAQVVYPNSAPAGSVYYPSAKGCQMLAEHTGDDTFLAISNDCPAPHHILHWLAVSDTHIVLNEAIALQQQVQLCGWFNEWDTVNPDEQQPEQRYRLYTLLRDNPRLVCAPDAAFMLAIAGYSKVFYLEQDRGTSGVRQVAARKIKGYVELAACGLHSRHFPETNVADFSVLCIAPNPGRRDALRRAFRGKEGAELWKFAAVPELNSDSFLFEPCWYRAVGEAQPLVKLPQSSEA